MTTFNSAKETEKLFDQTARALNLTDESYTLFKNALRKAFVIDQEIKELDQEIKELDEKLDKKIEQMWANC